MKSDVLPLLCAVALVAACADRQAADPSASRPSGPSLSAYLTTASAVQMVGDDVTVDFRVRRVNGAPLIGSYLIDILLDTAAIRSVRTTATEGIVASNVVARGIRVAGANSDGFQNDRLASVTFKAINPAVIESMRLQVAELNSTTFQDQRSIVTIAPLVLGPVHARQAK